MEGGSVRTAWCPTQQSVDSEKGLHRSCLRSRRLVVFPSIDQHHVLISRQVKSLQDAVDFRSFSGPEVHDHLDGILSVARPLINLCLLLEIPFELGVLGELELDNRLVSPPSRHLEVRGAPAVIYLTAYIRRRGIPRQSVQDMHIFFPVDRLSIN